MHSLRDTVDKVSAEVAAVPENAVPSVLQEGRIFKNVPLHSHQIEGVKWMLRRWQAKRSIIVADEMGLGKTLQTLAFSAYLLDHYGVLPPILVIAPLSVAPQWAAQSREFIPSLRVFEYFGSAEVRESKRRFIIEDNILRLPKPISPDPQPLPFDVMISTYETCLADMVFISNFKWRVIVFDEGHRLKNPESVTHQVFASNLCSTAFKIILTGTPIQNNFSEFLSLLQFLHPNDFDIPETGQDITQLIPFGPSIVRALVLRRLFKDINIQLPPIEEIVIRTEMTPLQSALYQWVLYRSFVPPNFAIPNGLFSNVLMTLRKIASHPYLIPGIEPEPFIEGEHIYKSSNKLSSLQDLLIQLRIEKSRALIFSSFTSLLDICQDMLDLLSISYERLDGSVRGEDRVAALSRFRSDEETNVFLLSTRAGGVGLNLASANWVIFLDSDWNPQVDLQAIARVFRQGQIKPVKVFRLVSEKSVDEVILHRGEGKLGLARIVLEDLPERKMQTFASSSPVDSNSLETMAPDESWRSLWGEIDQQSVARIDTVMSRIESTKVKIEIKEKIQKLTAQNRERKKMDKWKELGYTSLTITMDSAEARGEAETGALIHLHGSLVQPVVPDGIICHCVDTSGVWAKSHLFQSIARVFPEAPSVYRRAKEAGDLHVGDVHLLGSLALLVCKETIPAQFGQCLERLSQHFSPASTTFHFARVGEQHGTLYMIERLIKRYLSEFNVYMYYFNRETAKEDLVEAKPIDKTVITTSKLKTLFDYFEKLEKPTIQVERKLSYSISDKISLNIANALKRDIVHILKGRIESKPLVYVTSIFESQDEAMLKIRFCQPNVLVENSVPNPEREGVVWVVTSETVEAMIRDTVVDH